MSEGEQKPTPQPSPEETETTTTPNEGQQHQQNITPVQPKQKENGTNNTPSKKRFDEVAHLKKERTVMKQQLEDLRKERNALRLQIDSLKSENDYIRGMHEESEAKLRDVSTKCKELDSQLSEKSIQCEKLQKQVAVIESDKKVEVAQCEAEVSQVKKRLAEVMSRDIEQLRAEAEKATKRALEAEERIEENRKAARAAEEKELKERVGREEEARAKETWKVRALEAENASTKANENKKKFEALISSQEKRIQELEAILESDKSQIEQLQKDLESEQQKEKTIIIKQEKQQKDFEGLKELEVLGAKIGELQMEKRIVVEENKTLKEQVSKLSEQLNVWKSETVKNYILYFGTVKSNEQLEKEKQEQTKRASFMNYLWRGYSVDGLPQNVSQDLSTKMHRVLEETLYQNVKQQDEIDALKKELNNQSTQIVHLNDKIAEMEKQKIINPNSQEIIVTEEMSQSPSETTRLNQAVAPELPPKPSNPYFPKSKIRKDD
ncbi:hypothetical protein EHI8A_179120 [Entamoeba histolytica HM-1:IMSS-B]|uniref:Uncharacterized protein n=4 Tax=Entamoeba histolytica TaxID=5759 RepID=C4LXS8_ENTH1|nr:hypothetical protein, conserved [Entamoeba histolytica HM-1:IMSS]EAL43309.1 hypothetical protein, conserved [Entamoeba histolytica HM-1:IMSS]EMH74815.1 hypothetical protein EHI8A_179120 [Entamoeba histolytica HM-1:IMSS-B]ENY62557.1 caldesmon, putative [Entamoeba histolytica HM-1:IMSS-A]GAT93576.1 hypothetical protein conserved [Entamoeba histolytica]|eukprot:XP_648695.1 hypothetical protein, conserved [Entamoeba histolytica HM-1:IMSS]